MNNYNVYLYILLHNNDLAYVEIKFGSFGDPIAVISTRRVYNKRAMALNF